MKRFRKVNIQEVIYAAIVFFASLILYTSAVGAQSIVFAVAFLVYNVAILNYYRHTGLTVLLFMISDCIYSYFQYGYLPYLNMILYTCSLIFEVYASMKRGISLKNRLLSPNVNNRLSKKTILLSFMFTVTVVLYLMASKADSIIYVETDAITIIISATLSCLSLASVLAIAFRTVEALPVIFLVYLVGSINTLRMFRYGNLDIIQIFDTVIVTISLIMAYIKYKRDKKTYDEIIEESREGVNKDEEVKS